MKVTEAADVDDMQWSEMIFQKELIKALLQIRDQVYTLNDISEVLTESSSGISDIDGTLHQIGLKLKEGIATFPQCE